MIQLSKNGFESSYDVNGMLYNDMVWLSNRINMPVKEFEKIAKQMELTQENWTRFWRVVRSCRLQERNIEVLINDKERVFTEEEFEVAKQILGSPERVSNCCTASIDDEGLCSDCGEHCGSVYLF